MIYGRGLIATTTNASDVIRITLMAYMTYCDVAPDVLVSRLTSDACLSTVNAWCSCCTWCDRLLCEMSLDVQSSGIGRFETAAACSVHGSSRLTCVCCCPLNGCLSEVQRFCEPPVPQYGPYLLHLVLEIGCATMSVKFYTCTSQAVPRTCSQF
jgi:hypothetical protein